MSATIEHRDLSGARASSAVRCKAMAEFQGLHAEKDESQQRFLQRYFDRGLELGKLWAQQQVPRYAAQGKTAIAEHAAPWGIGWSTHADLYIVEDDFLWEAYVAKGGVFRPEKALQAAFGADVRGPHCQAALAAIDPEDISPDGGMAIHTFPVNVDGLRDEVRDIQARVIAAVKAGAVNSADKVSDTPAHNECRSCVFAAQCWEDYRPPMPEEVVGLETTFEALRITESDLHHATSNHAAIKTRRDALREELRPYLPPGREVTSGGTRIRRTEIPGRITFQTAAYLNAGHQLTPEQEAFVKHGEPSERWKVEPA